MATASKMSTGSLIILVILRADICMYHMTIDDIVGPIEESRDAGVAKTQDALHSRLSFSDYLFLSHGGMTRY